MNEEIVSLQELLAIAKKHWAKAVVCVCVCAALGVGVSQVLPKKFKSTALLNVQATYFDVPLLGESIVGSKEGTEMQSQKLALFRLALTDEFWEQEGEKFGVFKFPKGTSEHMIERDALKKGVDYFPASSTTFQISATGNTADMAMLLAMDVLDQVVTTFFNERRKSLMAYRDSLRKQVETLGVSISAQAAPGASAGSQVLKEELRALLSKLSALEAQFSSSHPTVAAMKQKEAALRQMIAKAGNEASGQDAGLLAAAPHLKKSEAGEELLKKIRYLDITLSLEGDKNDLPYLEIIERPIRPMARFFPKTINFMVGGLLMGFVLSGMIIGFFEFKRASAMTPQMAAQLLETTFLGGLPTMLSVNRPAPSMDRSADLDEASEESEEESDDDLSDVDQGANDKAGTAQS